MRKKVLPLLDAARAEKNVSEKVCPILYKSIWSIYN